jgi:hypothetical protein
MTKSKNYQTKRTGTKDGQISFGHIHDDQVKSSILIQGQEALEYVCIDQTEPRKRWITSRCRGRYQIKCADDIAKDQIGYWLNASTSDILIARGPDTSSGVINLISNESINLETKKATINGNESISIFTDGEMLQSAINIMKIYSGSIQKMTSRSAIRPPSVPILKSLTQYSSPFPV